MQILDGRSHFYQWDFGIKLTSPDLKVGDEVHFHNKIISEPLTTKAYEDGGQVVVDVPNILLQNDVPLFVFQYVFTEESGYTNTCVAFKVLTRPKPADYVYTETEIITVKGYVDDALRQAIESGEFDGKDGKSAYEIAVEHGFEGTKEEWIASLGGDIDTSNLLEKPDETAAENEWSEDNGEFLEMHVLVRQPDGSKVWQSVRKRDWNDGHLPVYHSGGNIMVAWDQDELIDPDPDNPNWEYDAYGYNYALSIPAAKKHFARQTTKTVTERVDIEHDPITGIVKFIMSPVLDEPLEVSFEMYYCSDESEYQNGYSFTLPANVEVCEYPERFVGDEWSVNMFYIHDNEWYDGERTVTYSVHNPDVVEVKKSLTVRGKKVLTEDDIPLGDIDTALDAILAIQASLIGGDA